VQPIIRGYRPADLGAVYDICVRTAEGGAGAVGRYASDLLMGDIFAAPYVTHEPQHAYVLDDGDGTAVGYILGTADTPAFVRWYREVWIPETAERMPPPADPPVTPDDGMLALHHQPERMLVPELAGYPAHLHIDLLPEFQGKGWGRGFMNAFLTGIAAAGVARVHLGMATTNSGARSFYDRLGFHEIAVADAGPVTYLGIETGVAGPRLGHPGPRAAS
jgi:ribosomal protein S18 acetylase RimI-like enzyme